MQSKWSGSRIIGAFIITIPDAKVDSTQIMNLMKTMNRRQIKIREINKIGKIRVPIINFRPDQPIKSNPQ